MYRLINPTILSMNKKLWELYNLTNKWSKKEISAWWNDVTINQIKIDRI